MGVQGHSYLTARGNSFLEVSLVIEAKNSALGIDTAIPQALGYMIANPQAERFTYGLVTNGSSFAFLKLSSTPEPRYEVSDVMLLLPGRNVLGRVLQVMKRLGRQLSA